MADPIWRDISFNVTSGNYFRISGGHDEDGNTGVFYQGRAVSPTGSGTATVYYNRICFPRMYCGHPTFFTIASTACCQQQTFTIQTSSNGTSWSTQTTKTFMPDWSYRTNTATNRNARINDHFNASICLFYSALGSSTSVALQVGCVDGTTDSDGSKTIAAAGGTVSYPLSTLGYDELRSAKMGNLVWATPVNCAPGALYYRNAFGGWDSLLIEGAFREYSDTAHHTRKVFENNSLSPYRGENDYINEVTRRWTVSTHGMTDDESALMWHLLESPDVWIHDFAQGSVLPVIIDDGSQEIKTYRNNGRQVSVYTLSMRLAQERIRR